VLCCSSISYAGTLRLLSAPLRLDVCTASHVRRPVEWEWERCNYRATGLGARARSVTRGSWLAWAEVCASHGRDTPGVVPSAVESSPGVAATLLRSCLQQVHMDGGTWACVPLIHRRVTFCFHLHVQAQSLALAQSCRATSGTLAVRGAGCVLHSSAHCTARDTATRVQVLVSLERWHCHPLPLTRWLSTANETEHRLPRSLDPHSPSRNP
jgi:hypothetical protein